MIGTSAPNRSNTTPTSLFSNIEDYKSGKITYAEAEFNARNRIYQSVKPDFNPDIEYMKDPLSRDIPSVDNSLFILARKLILEL